MGKKTTDTSAASLRELHENGTINRQHIIVMQAVRLSKQPRTDRELHSMTSQIDLIAFRARRNELWNKGLIARHEKRVCSLTGKTVYTWHTAINVRL